ncbi:hypothetical protein [Bergeyella cardium]|uniref:Uncharacterized protein n=1 Tax=Bergeyella cardium TaxID=1585976 RepID=A0A6P1QVJ2_9FLAO|nr:hypothetical protein [Bergeyella cardium]QHN64841.1 hypothetical protein DBX24_02505 [Bergeyella cardium]WHE34148.1 hypothetical protein P8603_02520 [Bergeyella cardium]WHF60799.1 hypothetical protein O0R51_02515 [Bergeyella cardium]
MSRAQQGQSFIDMVYQMTGGFEDIMKMAVLNEKSITDDIEVDEIIISDNVQNNEMIFFFQRNKPATAITAYNIEQEKDPEGISYWAINGNFKVS